MAEFRFVTKRMRASSKLDGVMFHTSDDGEESIVPAVWHGIDQGHVDRVWFPDHECCSGVMPSEDDEIVVDEGS